MSSAETSERFPEEEIHSIRCDPHAYMRRLARDRRRAILRRFQPVFLRSREVMIHHVDNYNRLLSSAHEGPVRRLVGDRPLVVDGIAATGQMRAHQHLVERMQRLVRKTLL